MNTPTPTEAHLDLVESVRYSNDRSAALQIAESEARAVAAAVSSLTCTHHTDQQRAACPVCLVATITAERDQLRAEVKSCGELSCDECNARTAALTARAERAEAELASERGKLDWVFRNCKVTADDFTTGNRDVYYVHDREDLGAAMREEAK